MHIDKSKIILVFLTLTITVLIAVAAFSAGNKIDLVAPGATIKTVQSGFNGTEGPAADAAGNVYFTEKGGNSIQKWTWKDGKVSLYRKIDGGAIGMAFDARGRLLICEMENGRVTRDDMKGGSLQVIADSCDGKKIHIPNDIWVNPNGGTYFTDFSFAGMKLPAGNAMPGGLPGGMPPGANEKISPGDLGIDYIAPDGKVTRVANLDSPNGLIGTPDGKTLYANDGDKICSYAIGPDGSLTDKKVFCNQSTDGMALDEKGDLYLIGDSITVFNPKGEKIDEIALPEKKCKNLTFGGKNRSTLFISGNVAVYTLEMSVKGAPTALDLASGNK